MELSLKRKQQLFKTWSTLEPDRCRIPEQCSPRVLLTRPNGLSVWWHIDEEYEYFPDQGALLLALFEAAKHRRWRIEVYGSDFYTVVIRATEMISEEHTWTGYGLDICDAALTAYVKALENKVGNAV